LSNMICAASSIVVSGSIVTGSSVIHCRTRASAARARAATARIAAEVRRHGVTNERQPYRIELVQRREFAGRIPPLLGQRRKLGDFGFVNG